MKNKVILYFQGKKKKRTNLMNKNRINQIMIKVIIKLIIAV
jgi:hypothetical protein